MKVIESKFQAVVNDVTLVFDDNTVDRYNLHIGQGMMFYFNYQQRRCWFEIENEIDSFRLRPSYSGSLEIRSKEICDNIRRCLNVEDRITIDIIREGGNRFYLVHKLYK